MIAIHPNLNHHSENFYHTPDAAEQRLTVYILMAVCYILIAVSLFMVWSKV